MFPDCSCCIHVWKKAVFFYLGSSKWPWILEKIYGRAGVLLFMAAKITLVHGGSKCRINTVPVHRFKDYYITQTRPCDLATSEISKKKNKQTNDFNLGAKVCCTRHRWRQPAVRESSSAFACCLWAVNKHRVSSFQSISLGLSTELPWADKKRIKTRRHLIHHRLLMTTIFHSFRCHLWQRLHFPDRHTGTLAPTR